ncbi:Flp family type IVb pilin [Blastomonas marina]|nr:Flp family type IVb pilin [Blastomonas marina]WPZ04868.1 Flp family type IVb pilin [Blastomonas marina]
MTNRDDMMTGKQFLQAMLRDQRGATSVEYGLIIAMIFLGLVGVATGLADENSQMWNTVSNDISTATAQANSV